MIVQILLVDDDAGKVERTTRVVRERLGDRNVEIINAPTAHDAAACLERTRFDLMVLDLNLPRRGGEPPKHDGGLLILRQLVKGGPRLRRPTHIVGLTAFPDLLAQFNNEFQEEGWQLIQYDDTSDSWELAVGNKVLHIAEAIAPQRTGEEYRCDVAVLTALKHIELEAVLDLDARWSERRLPGDDTFYFNGVFERDGRKVSVVAASALEMGMVPSACLAMKTIHNFRPRYVAMAGITAGVGGNFGDVVVADQAWDYGSGKLLTGGRRKSLFAPSPSYVAIDAALKEMLMHFISSKPQVIAGIPTRWRGGSSERPLTVRVGPMASGAAVIENEAAVNGILQHNRKVVAIEMETYGLYFAARACIEPRPAIFSAKAVCDFGVPPKTDEYQRYAAFTSANFIYEFAIDQLAQRVS